MSCICYLKVYNKEQYNVCSLKKIKDRAGTIQDSENKTCKPLLIFGEETRLQNIS